MAIEARLAHADVAIDGHVCGASIGGGGDLMPVHGGRALGDDGDLFRGYGIDDAEAGVSLIHDQERLPAGGGCKTESRYQKTHAKRLSHGKHYSRFKAGGLQPLTEMPEKDIRVVPRTGWSKDWAGVKTLKISRFSIE